MLRQLPQIVALMLLGGSLAACALLWTLYESARRATVEVPDLRGLALADAEETLGNLDLLLEVRDYAFDENAPKDTLLTQEPAPGAVVKVGRRVFVVASMGVRQVTVPRLRGLSVEDGGNVLAGAGLLPGREYALTAEGAPGRILASSPPMGEGIPEGERVHLLVSSGPEDRFPMPDFLGSPFDEAATLLREAGLALEAIETEDRPSLPHNTIVGQRPMPGDVASPGALVTLRVGRNLTTRPREDAGTYVVVAYTVPDDLIEAPLAIVRRRKGAAEPLWQGTAAGGETIRIPAMVQRGDEMLAKLNGVAVWKETY